MRDMLLHIVDNNNYTKHTLLTCNCVQAEVLPVSKRMLEELCSILVDVTRRVDLTSFTPSVTVKVSVALMYEEGSLQLPI